MATYLWFSASSFVVFGFVDFLFYVVVMTTCVTLRFVLPLFPISLLIHVRSVNPSLLLCSPHSSMVLLRVSRVLCSNSQISVLLLEFRLPLILWTSFYILCFCIWTMGFHYTVARFWFLSACFHVCVWVAFCVTLRISSSSPPSMGSRLFWWVYTWYKGKQCVLPVLNGHARCQGKEPTITEKSVRSCCVENNK